MANDRQPMNSYSFLIVTIALSVLVMGQWRQTFFNIKAISQLPVVTGSC